MAEVRKSATQAAARKRAREKAAAFREKQDTLEQLAVDYFVATDGLDAMSAEIERELAAVRTQGDKRLATARAEADQVIAAMLKLGVTRNEVADRLGITTRDIKRPKVSSVSEPKRTAPPRSDDSGEATVDEHVNESVSA